MLTLEFINSPDENIVGEYSTYRRVLFLGRNSSNDIIIDDPEITSTQLKIQMLHSGLMITSRDSHGYLSNKKKVVGSKVHTAGDEIQIGQTIFKIKSYTPPKFISYQEELQASLKETTEKNPEAEKILSYLEKELLEIEKDLINEK